MTAFYQRWAASSGLRDRPPEGEHDPDRPYLTFEHAERDLNVAITCELPSSVLIYVWRARPD